MSVTIYHNPACGTSRNALAMIRASGVEPLLIEYLKDPPTRETLRQMIADAGLTVREALRRKGTPYDALGLDDARLTEDDLLDRMMEHPILINRPFVIAPRGTRLCRPSERVLDLLPEGAVIEFTKEDGEVIRRP